MGSSVFVRICPYLSDFVKKNCKFLIFSTFNPLKILVFLAKLPKIHYLCNVTKQLRRSYQKSHLAHLFSPNLSQESANRRLRRWINGDQKLCENLRKVGFFDHQRDHFFTKKEVELIFEYIGDPYNWLEYNKIRFYDCHLVILSSCQNQMKIVSKLLINIYIY